MENALEPPEFSNSITLIGGTAPEIGKALEELWASKTTIAKSSVSFLIKLPPGSVVRRIEGGFQIGQSFLPEGQSGVKQEIGGVHSVVAKIMAASNDAKFTLAA